jgi:hypothetical protein
MSELIPMPQPEGPPWPEMGVVYPIIFAYDGNTGQVLLLDIPAEIYTYMTEGGFSRCPEDAIDLKHMDAIDTGVYSADATFHAWTYADTPDSMGESDSEFRLDNVRAMDWGRPIGTYPSSSTSPRPGRFVSQEPQLGPVVYRPEWLDGIDWIIIGGESGPPGARPFDIDWARQTITQSRAAGVACFVKQLGRFPNGNGFPADFDYRKRDRKGGDMDEWPEDIRVREFPGGGR